MPSSVAKAALLVAALALACGPPARDRTGSIDLGAGLAGADVVSPTVAVDPDSAADFRHFLPRWDFKYTLDRLVAVGLGEASSLWFFSASPKEIELALHGTSRPWVETLTVQVNETLVASLPTLEGPQVYQVTVPADAVQAGRNVLTLLYGSDDPELPYSSDLPAMYWHRFELTQLGALPASQPRLTERGLFIPFGTRLDYFIELPAAASLDVGEVRFTGGTGRLRVELEKDLEGIVTLAEVGADEAVEAIEVGNPEPQLVRLSLEATSASTTGSPRAGVILAEPAIYPGETSAPATVRREATPPAPEPAGRNLLLYVIDTLRADHLGMYGYPRDVSPHLDRFAAGATLFANAHAQASWTRASMASLFTGLWPGLHGATGRKDRLSPEAVTLAELLQQGGYQTKALTMNAMVSPTFGFDQGIEVHTTTEVDDPLVLLPMLEEWLDGYDPKRPFFLWIHVLGPHDPYTPPAELRERFVRDDRLVEGLEQPPHLHQERMLRHPESDREQAVARWLDLYDGEIVQYDEAFRSMMELFAARGLLDSTLIVVVSDHGEEFLEHGNIVHGNSLFAESIRVPLVIRHPDRGHGRRVGRVVDHLDLMPTMLDWAGIEAPEGIEGASLLPLLDDPQAPHRRFSFQHVELEDTFHTAVTEGRWRLVQDRSVADGRIRYFWLFDQVHDPQDRVNAAQFYPVRVGFMERLIEARLLQQPAWETAEAELDEKTEEALRALGYLQ